VRRLQDGEAGSSADRSGAPGGRCKGEGWVERGGERFYRIPDYDLLEPFFMSLASADDHWFYISSTGGLTAGRRDPDGALFPYYTDDRVSENAGNTGHAAVLRVFREGETRTWEPFSSHPPTAGRRERALYKSARGDVLVFEEIDRELALAFSYSWRMSGTFGFVKTSRLEELGRGNCRVELVDGLLNLLPAGTSSGSQLALSNLLDAYKRGELVPEAGLGIFSYGSLLSDRAEPCEALRATTAWATGLEGAGFHLSDEVLHAFRRGAEHPVREECRGRRCAWLARAGFDLDQGAAREWRLVAEVERDGAEVADLAARLGGDRRRLEVELEEDLRRGAGELDAIVARADGLQLSGEPNASPHHYADTLFNIMRGGIFAQGHLVNREDFRSYLSCRNSPVFRRSAAFLEGLPPRLPRWELVAAAAAAGDPSLERLAREYLPLMFGRRHGDPSRPWNRFAIRLRNADGSPRLDYQGNWRDLFQNWEALAWSHPAFAEAMIAAFVDATTADGYNPYRLMREGLEWEVPDPENPWSNIGYWSDHQIIYLQKLLEVSSRFNPGELEALLDRRIRSHAAVPYRIRPYAALVADPLDSIQFDREAHRRVEEARVELGSDARLLRGGDGEVLHVSLAEKLLVNIMAKLGNYVPGGGIWMNTQRPEWNDANNALVGKGLSVVTTAYLLRHLDYVAALFRRSPLREFGLSVEVRDELLAMSRALEAAAGHLAAGHDDRTRRALLDALGAIASAAREELYARGPSGRFAPLDRRTILDFLGRTRAEFAATLLANRRPDGLYHSYNLLALEEGRAGLGRLDEMLEGQVALLSSGLLSPSEALGLLEALRASRLYRADQDSYLLYPDRELRPFLGKGRIAGGRMADLPLLGLLAARGGAGIIERDASGAWHFGPELRNSSELRRRLGGLAGDRDLGSELGRGGEDLVALYEETFGHATFTGRSGSFFAYEGLGSIYWHMVTKLQLAVLECHDRAAAEGASRSVVEGLLAAYLAVRGGLGQHKGAAAFGAFPTDPYSHTPAGRGAKQPGMTGMVKEEILARLGELGLSVEGGLLSFRPLLLGRRELLVEPAVFTYRDLEGRESRLEVPAGGLALTFCQVPVIRVEAAENYVELETRTGTRERRHGLVLDAATSRSIFERRGDIVAIVVGSRFEA